MNDYRKIDQNGKLPLSGKEYEVIRSVYGAVSAFSLCNERLKERAGMVKNLWRDLRLLQALSNSVLIRLLETIPANKLRQMQKDLDNTISIVKVKGVSGKKTDGYMYVSEEAIIDLCKAATKMTCFGCEKTHSEARKTCQLYKEIKEIFAYEFDDYEICPLNGGDFD